MNKQLRADLMLIFVTMGWGISYFLMDLTLTEMGAFTLNAFRFCGAFIVAGIVLFPKLKTVNKATLKQSALLGTILVFVYICATFGTANTTISNAGFLCGLTVVFTPFYAYVLFKKKPEKKVIVAILLCLVGVALLTLNDDFTVNRENLLGDILCIGCSVFYALHLVFTERAVSKKEVNALQVGVFQLGVTGLWTLSLSFIFEQPALPQSTDVLGAVIFLSLFCTGLAFIIQTVAQQYTSASHVGVIFTLEPVFCAITSIFLVGEILTFKSYIGGAIMFFAIICMETGIVDKIKVPKRKKM